MFNVRVKKGVATPNLSYGQKSLIQRHFYANINAQVDNCDFKNFNFRYTLRLFQRINYNINVG